MDATTRWETEAIRSGSSKRTNPPRPTAKKKRASAKNRTWVTLKEAEDATGIPSNTLRKWVRKESIETYLESDGEMALRMVDLDSVRERARELGREIPEPVVDTGDDTIDEVEVPDEARPSQAAAEIHDEDTPESQVDDVAPQSAPAGTMLVPIDAWNKMLNQLGNLHEAGQQLAEARERAAKAETEAKFLRERLQELRVETQTANTEYRIPNTEPDGEAPDSESGGSDREAPERTPPETTTYWRYLTTGWRDRKRRSRS